MTKFYKRVSNPKHQKSYPNGTMLEHRLIAELKIGRMLLDTEVVHHIDENKFNNNPDNLIVFKTTADHSRYHKTGIMVEIEDNIFISPEVEKKITISNCINCGHEFEKKSKKQKFCNPDCYAKSMEREKPSKDEMVNLITNNPISRVAKICNVSDTTIRKWCEEYGLPSKNKDIKQLKNSLKKY